MVPSDYSRRAHSETRVTVARRRLAQVDAANKERRTCTRLNRAYQLWFRSTARGNGDAHRVSCSRGRRSQCNDFGGIAGGKLTVRSTLHAGAGSLWGLGKAACQRRADVGEGMVEAGAEELQRSCRAKSNEGSYQRVFDQVLAILARHQGLRFDQELQHPRVHCCALPLAPTVGSQPAAYRTIHLKCQA